MKHFLKQIAATTSALALLVALIPAQPVHAAFPGLNGRIVFHSNRTGNNEIYSMKLDGSDVVQLTDNAGLGSSNPTFSSDGTKIIFDSGRDGNQEIYVMDADGSNQTRITNNPASTEGEPSFSRDGEKIVFRSNQDGNNEIYIMNADGSSQTRITNDSASDIRPRFSLDGETILYRKNTATRTIKVTGADDTLVRSPATGADWSPDNTKAVLAFLDAVHVFNFSDSSTTQITLDGTGRNSEPNYSPDGQKLVYRSNRSGFEEVYIINIDGTGETQLTNTGTANSHIASIQPLTIVPSTIDPSITLNATQGSVTYDAPANHTDSYEDLDPASVTITTQPQKGSVSVNTTTGEITYTPNQQATTSSILAALDNLFFQPASAQASNQDSFTYQICSTANSQLCTQTTVTVNLAGAVLASTGSNLTIFLAASAIATFSSVIFWLARRRFYA